MKDGKTRYRYFILADREKLMVLGKESSNLKSRKATEERYSEHGKNLAFMNEEELSASRRGRDEDQGHHWSVC